MKTSAQTFVRNLAQNLAQNPASAAEPSVGMAGPLSRRQWLTRAGLAVAAVPSLGGLAACGGGGSDSASSSGTGGTSGTISAAYASGAISGFGSIIVNGVRYDETGAQLLDDRGRSRSASALKLGVVVEVDSSVVNTATARATAARIRCASPLLGPLEAIDATAGTVIVLGQTVTVSTDTVLDTTLATDLSTWTLGAVLAVHGLYDTTTDSIAATRVEPATAPTVYLLRGTVSALDATAKTFQIGTAVINYASATSVLSTLADGVVVRLELQTTPVSSQWVANVVASGVRTVEDRSHASVHGLITAWTSASAFSVNGLVVDASAASFPDGSAGIVLGAQVEVEGAITSGVLVATSVSLDDNAGSVGAGHGGADDHGGHGGRTSRREFELHGTLSALDTTAQTFSLRGLTVSYASSTLVWRDSLSASTLANGLAVEVHGVLSADRTQLSATRIELDN